MAERGEGKLFINDSLHPDGYPTLVNGSQIEYIMWEDPDGIEPDLIVWKNNIIPNEPTNFIATNDLQGQINFTWTNSTRGGPEPTYAIYKVVGVQDLADGTGETDDILIVDNLSGENSKPNEYLLNTAQGTGAYYVRATNVEGSANSNTDEGESQAAPGDINFSASDNLVGEIEFTWVPSGAAPEPTYTIYKKNIGWPDTIVVASPAQQNSKINVTPPDTSDYVIKAENVHGVGWGEDSGTSNIPTFAPSQVLNLDATTDLVDKIIVTWDPPSSGTLPIYYEGNFGGNVVSPITSGYTWTTTGGRHAGDWGINITPYNSIGRGPNSFVTGTALRKPVNNGSFKASDDLQDRIQISWSDFDGYPEPTYEVFKNGASLRTNATSPFDDPQVTLGPDGPHSYYLVATNSAGSVTTSPDNGTALQATNAPSDPANFTATGGGDAGGAALSEKITFYWDESTGFPTPTYNLYYKDAGNVTRTINTNLSAAQGAAGYDWIRSGAFGPFEMWVEAVNGQTPNGKSLTNLGECEGPPPEPPIVTNLTFDASINLVNQIKFTFTEDPTTPIPTTYSIHDLGTGRVLKEDIASDLSSPVYISFTTETNNQTTDYNSNFIIKAHNDGITVDGPIHGGTALKFEKPTEEIFWNSSSDLTIPAGVYTIDVYLSGQGGTGAYVHGGYTPSDVWPNPDNTSHAGGGSPGNVVQITNVTVTAGDVLSWNISGSTSPLDLAATSFNGPAGATNTAVCSTSSPAINLTATGGAGGTINGSGGNGLSRTTVFGTANDGQKSTTSFGQDIWGGLTGGRYDAFDGNFTSGDGGSGAGSKGSNGIIGVGNGVMSRGGRGLIKIVYNP